tara:strand:+ start:535 stop:828 length:294 start_codon:yes stop_codon:yes gene_type:complete
MKKVNEIVLDVLNELGEMDEKEDLINASESTILFGRNFDSMGIVMLTVEIEEQIFDEYGIEIILADERAMSQKTSPFRNVKTLVKYIESLIEEEKDG